jgi:hypothetical protein
MMVVWPMTDQVQPTQTDKTPLPSADMPGGNSPFILLKGEIEIYTEERLAKYDQGPIKAYAARSKTREKAIAYLCESHLVPQIHPSSMYYAIHNFALPKLIGAGVVDWDPLKQQRYVFVYEDNLGNPVSNSSNVHAMGLKQDLVLNTVIRNLVPALKDMRDVDFIHGNIRVSNLYDGGSQNLEKIMLGECLSAPCGFLQPALYETIERAACNPLGKGRASYEDDMYAFGVTLAVLLRESDPLADLSDNEIIARKIELGSYAALTGKERFSGSLLECLRGLLNDDRKQRWTVDDLVTWMEGRRVHPRPGANTRLKASRPIEFNKEKYLLPQLLALDLPKSPKETVRLVESNDLGQWLNRSLQDKSMEERVDSAIEQAHEGGNSGFYPDRLSCYIVLALVPSMPMIFRGLSFVPQAFGQMLVEACLLKKDLNPFVEIIQNQMALFWINTQDTPTADASEIISKFDICRAFLRHAVAGYGVERSIYFLSPESQCLSEKLKNFYVRTSEDMLIAFEHMAESGNLPEEFFDRHIIAFLSVRDRQIIDPYIPDLNSEEKHRRILATLQVLSAIQKRSQMSPMPAVTASLIDGLDPLINRFHDRDTRARIRTQLQKLRDKGEISKVAALFNNPQVFHEDFGNFKIALSNYSILRQEHSNLSRNLDENKEFGRNTGRQIAAIVSGALATLMIVIYLTYKFSGGGGWEF